MYQHTTGEIVMIKPCAFQFNTQTAVNNAYQNNDDANPEQIQKKALAEFNNLVDMLESKGVVVNVIEDTKEPPTPDSIFPNNWFSTHEDGTLVIYPMFAENRRLEITKLRDKIEKISENSFKDKDFIKVIDYSKNFKNGKILEGTGSMVIDRKNKIAYCALSPRADKEMFLQFCKDTEHKGIYFTARQDGVLIYHTNVLMGIGEKNAIVCLDSIDDEYRDKVKQSLEESGKNIIEISLDQVKQFLGNTLELKGKDSKNFLAMSKTAYDALTEEQKREIEKDTEILAAEIPTIEFYGGGSVRCMMAEIF